MKKIIYFILISIVLFFIVKNFYYNYQKIIEYDFTDVRITYILGAIFITIVSLIYPIFVWKNLLACFSVKIPLKQLFSIWFISNMGRYLPGKIWQLIGIVSISKKYNIPAKISFHSIIYLQLFACSTGLFLSIFVLDDYCLLIKILLSLPIIIILIFPNIFIKLLNFLLVRLNREPLSGMLSRLEVLKFVFLQLVNWSLMGLSFVVLLRAFATFDLFNFKILFILPVAWTTGLLAVFAPGGVGVREYLLMTVLSTIIPIPLAIVFPWIHRLLVTTLEIVMAILGACILKFLNIEIKKGN